MIRWMSIASIALATIEGGRMAALQPGNVTLSVIAQITPWKA
jgi:hypothetical protein